VLQCAAESLPAARTVKCEMLCVTVCCSVLQCVAVCCSVLQCVAVCGSVLQCVAVCGTVLRCVAVCGSVLQCDAVCGSVWQCVAVRCGVFTCCTHRKLVELSREDLAKNRRERQRKIAIAAVELHDCRLGYSLVNLGC